MSAAEVASTLNVSKVTIYRMAKSGSLRYTRPTRGTMRFSRRDVEAYLRQVGIETEVSAVAV